MPRASYLLWPRWRGRSWAPSRCRLGGSYGTPCSPWSSQSPPAPGGGGHVRACVCVRVCACAHLPVCCASHLLGDGQEAVRSRRRPDGTHAHLHIHKCVVILCVYRHASGGVLRVGGSLPSQGLICPRLIRRIDKFFGHHCGSYGGVMRGVMIPEDPRTSRS